MPTAVDVAERFASLVALILFFGSAAFRVGVARPLARRHAARGESAAFADRLANAAARSAVAAASVLIVLALARLNAHVVELFDGWRQTDAASLKALVVHTTWGHAWMLQIVSALVVCVAAVFGKRADAWMMIPLALASGLGGHAASVREFGTVAIAFDSMHIAAAGAWIGGVWYVLVAFLLRGASEDVFRVVRRFNAIALACAATVVLTGLYASVIHVRSFHALLSSEYGLQLTRKLVFVLAMLGAGALNWRRGTPALASGKPASIRRGVAIELLFALTILLLTARLVLLPPPPA